MEVCPLHSGMEARQTELEHKVVALMAAQEMHQRTNGGGHVRRGEVDELKTKVAKLEKWQLIATIIIMSGAIGSGAMAGKLVQLIIQ
jgi:hypothetical protein